MCVARYSSAASWRLVIISSLGFVVLLGHDNLVHGFHGMLPNNAVVSKRFLVEKKGISPCLLYGSRQGEGNDDLLLERNGQSNDDKKAKTTDKPKVVAATKESKQYKDDSEDEELPSWVRAIRQWRPTTNIGENSKNNLISQEASTTDTAPPLLQEALIGIENITSPKSTSWLLDPILQSLGNFQELLSRESEENDNDGKLIESRDFLDLLDDNRDRSNTKPSMESILDSLEGAALIVNISASPLTTTAKNNNSIEDNTGMWDPSWDDGVWNRWDRWMTNMQQALSLSNNNSTKSLSLTPVTAATTSSTNLTAAAESILRQATSRLERFLPEAVVPAASSLQAVLEMTNATAALAMAATEQSIDLNEAAVERAQQLGSFVGQLKAVADGLLRQGYVSAAPTTLEQLATPTATVPASNTTAETTQTTISNRTYRVATPGTKSAKSNRRRGGALFENFSTASELDKYTPILGQAAEMAAMAGLIYEQTVPRARQLGHSIAARGCSKNVKWMVTDSLASHSALELYKDRIDNDPAETPLLIRTITIRGFDAGDDEVDRDLLVNQVCTANPEPLSKQYKYFMVHGGLWGIAKAIYKDIKQYIDWTTDQHKIVLSGHSIGGSLANMVLFLLTLEKGADFVQERILRVYTFGSPPVAALSNSAPKRGGRNSNDNRPSTTALRCDILESLGLPCNLVWAFVQPWDPICRLFSEIDSLYPLIGDMGPSSDGITPWPSGPPRTLRPVTKAILEAWSNWPRFRDTYYETGSQSYSSVGIQHVLLPDATRYLTDRFLTVSIAVPPVRSILRIAGHELYPALVTAFPLDVFEISYVPQAIRGFVHHFYPAYGFPLVEYVRLLEERAEPLLVRDNLASAWSSREEDDDGKVDKQEKQTNSGADSRSKESIIKVEEESNLWGSLASPWLSSSSGRDGSSNATVTSR